MWIGTLALSLGLAQEAELYQACQAGQADACATFTAAAARAWLRSDDRDADVMQRWRGLIGSLSLHDPCLTSRPASLDCRMGCRHGDDRACEVMEQSGSMDLDLLALLQRRCDHGREASCDAIAARGLRSVDDGGFGRRAEALAVTGDGLIVAQQDRDVTLMSRGAFASSLGNAPIVARGHGEPLVLELRDDRLLGGPVLLTDRVWSAPANPCTQATVSETDLWFVRGRRCDVVVRYDRAGGPIRQEVAVGRIVDALAPGPSGGFVALHRDDHQVAAYSRAGEPMWTAEVPEYSDTLTRDLDTQQLLVDGYRACLTLDLVSGAAVPSTECVRTSGELEVTFGLRETVIEAGAASTQLRVPHASLAAPPNVLLDGAHGRVVVDGRYLLTLPGGERPPADAIAGRVERYDRARSRLDGRVVDGEDGAAATVQAYLVVGTLDAPHLAPLGSVVTDAEGRFTVPVPAHRPVALEARAGDRKALLWWAHDERPEAVLDLAAPAPGAPETIPCGPACAQTVADAGPQATVWVEDGELFLSLIEPLPAPVHGLQGVDLLFRDGRTFHTDVRWGLRVADDGTPAPGERRVRLVDSQGAPVMGMPMSCLEEGFGFRVRTDHEGWVRGGPDLTCVLSDGWAAVDPWRDHRTSERMGVKLPGPPKVALAASAAIATDVAAFEDFDVAAALAGRWEGPDGAVDLGLIEPEVVGPGVVKLGGVNVPDGLRRFEFLVFGSPNQAWAVGRMTPDVVLSLHRVPAE